MTRHCAVRAYQAAQATAIEQPDLSARIVGAILTLAGAVGIVETVRLFHAGWLP
jgi:hypothetical protein